MKRIILIIDYFLNGERIGTKEQVAWLDEQLICFNIYRVKVSDTWLIPKDNVRSRHKEVNEHLIIVDANLGFKDSRFVNIQQA